MLAANLVHFEVKGPAAIAGVGNGDTLSLDVFQANHVRLFYGKALLVIRTDAGTGGTISITAESPQLISGEASLQSIPDSL